MRIGIIGAGDIGGTLTRRLTALGHEVKVANSRDPETLRDLAAETGATAVWAGEAAKEAELVIVSIPQKNVPDLAPDLLSGLADGVPVIETNNYYPQQRDGRIAEIEDGLAESVWVAQHLGRPVIKAFNGIWWKHLLEKGVDQGTAGRIALPVAGADGPAKDLVFALIDQLGFDPIDGGSLAESWRQQPGTPVYGKDFEAGAAIAALAEATPERPAEFSADVTG
ncbi:NADPH-dependent F420 reductase [uncultured Jatrophihabitans sp.]|uniref:NADPH-dependent F420 reductase n=1 Tax=uncultured Jatrophihabitans sp. TaxID=1610747 RepID=UPI0035CC634E